MEIRPILKSIAKNIKQPTNNNNKIMDSIVVDKFVSNKSVIRLKDTIYLLSITTYLNTLPNSLKITVAVSS